MQPLEKFDFDFKVSLVEETIPNASNVWNLWTGNGNSGMDVVAEANGIDETQLSNGHRKQLRKRTWKIELTWNMIHEMEENVQLKENGIQDDTSRLHEFTENVSVTRKMCSLKVPTAASRSNGSCIGAAAPFKTMWTRYGSFGKLEVSLELSEPRRNPDAEELGFFGERSLVTLYKQNRKRNSTDCSYWEKRRK